MIQLKAQEVDSLVEELFLNIDFTGQAFKTPIASLVPDRQSRSGIPPWVWIIPTAGGGILVYTIATGESPPEPNLPEANDDEITIFCDEAGTLNVLSNDTGDQIQFLNFMAVSGVDISHSGGGILLISNPGLTDFSFTYTIVDQQGLQAVANVVVTVTVPSLNVQNDEYNYEPNLPVSGNILDNDSGDQLFVQMNTEPANGLLEISMDGNFIYTPNQGSCDSDVWTYTVLDVCGQTATGTVVLTSDDLDIPSITCPADVEISCESSFTPKATGKLSAIDNCTPTNEILITFEDDHSGLTGCNSSGTLHRTWMAIDLAGNQATCLQTIQIVDSDVPEISCPPDVVVGCSDDLEPSSTGEATATDPCGEVELMYTDEQNGDLCSFNGLVIIRTWTATDACGNSSSCSQMITVMADKEVPVLSCPPDAVLQCGDSTDPESTGLATAEDNCTESPSILIEFVDEESGNGCSADRVIVRTWTATDACGNTSSCEQMIVVEADLGSPVLSCTPDVILQCGDSTDPESTGIATAEDNCTESPSILIDFIDEESGNGCLADRVIVRTWTVTDACGNSSSCEQMITLEVDLESPLLSCPPDVILQCGDSTDPESTGMATAEDNCTESPSILIDFIDEESGNGCSADRVIVRTWTATDACGNSSSCEQMITLEADMEPPLVTCPPNISIPCNSENSPENTGLAEGVDHCGEETEISFTDLKTGICAGEIVRTWTAIDECGNASSCEQTITLEAVPCDFDIQVNGTDSECGLDNGTAMVNIVPGSVADGPFIIEWSHGPTTQNTNELGPGEYTVTVTDMDLDCSVSGSINLSEENPDYIEDIDVIAGDCSSNGNIILELQTPGSGPIRVRVSLPGGGFFVVNLSKGSDFILTNHIQNPPTGNYQFEVYDISLGNQCEQRFGINLVNEGGNLELELVSIINPSSPESNDGEVLLCLCGSNQSPPYNVFVNEQFVGQVFGNNIGIQGFTPGEYAIFVTSPNGCESNTIFVSMFPDSEGTGFFVTGGHSPPGILGNAIVHYPNYTIETIPLNPGTSSQPAYYNLNSFQSKFLRPLSDKVFAQLDLRMFNGGLTGQYATYESREVWNKNINAVVVSPSIKWKQRLDSGIALHLNLGFHYRLTGEGNSLDVNLKNGVGRLEFQPFALFHTTGLEYNLPSGNLIYVDIERYTEKMRLRTQVSFGFQLHLVAKRNSAHQFVVY